MKNENNKNDKDIYKKEYRDNLIQNKQRLTELFNTCHNIEFKNLTFLKKLRYFINYFLPEQLKTDKLQEKLENAISTLRTSDLKTTKEQSEFFKKFVDDAETEIENKKCFDKNENTLNKLFNEKKQQDIQQDEDTLDQALKDKSVKGYNLIRELDSKSLHNLTEPLFLTQLVSLLKQIKNVQDYDSQCSRAIPRINDMLKKKMI